MKKQLIFIVIFICCCQSTSKAQDNQTAEDALEEMQLLYNEGEMEIIIQRFPISSIKKLKGTKNDKISIWECLIKTHLYDENKKDYDKYAEEALKELFKLNPNYLSSARYEKVEEEMKMFIKDNGYEVRERFTFSGFSGINGSRAILIPNPNISIEEDKDIFSSDLPFDTFQTRVGWQAGLEARVHFLNVFEIGIGANYVARNHIHKGKKKTFDAFGPNNQRLVNIYTYNMKERQEWFDFSIFGGMNHQLGSAKLYANVGLTYHRLWKARFHDITSSVNHSDDPGLQLNSDNNMFVQKVDLLNIRDRQGNTFSLRRKDNLSAMAKIGARLPVSFNSYIFFEVQGQMMFKNLVNEEDRFQASNLTFVQGYVDADRRLNSFFFQLGFQKPVYFVYKNKTKEGNLFL